MAMKCSRCDYAAASGHTCPKCGAPMRMSLLAGSAGSGGDEADDGRRLLEPPGFGARVGQWLGGIIVAHVVGAMIVSLTVAALAPMGIDASKLYEERPETAATMSILVPVLATALAVMVACRGVYLAQLVGIAIGLTCAVAAPIEKMVLAEKLSLDLPVAAYEWLLLPPLCIAAGFFMGMRVGGTLQPVIKRTIQKADTWDPKARSKALEITPPSDLRWRRLIFGAVLGFVVIFFFRFLLHQIARYLYSGQAHIIGPIVGKTVPYLTFIGLVAAGTLAGSRTQTGFFQGLVAGLLIFVSGYVFQTFMIESVVRDDFRMLLLYCVTITPACGIIGRFIFRPARVFKSTQDYTG